MARSGINYVDVSKAAEIVRQNNEEPTVDRVRAVMGTGSKSTIAPLLRKWKDQSGDTQVMPGVPKELSDAVQSVYEQAKAAANAEFAKKEESIAQKHEDLVKNLNKTASQLADQKEENQSLSDFNTELKTNLSASQEQNTQLQTGIVKLQAEFRQTQALLSNAKETIGELKSENKDIRAHFEHFQHYSSEERHRERDEYVNSLQAERDRNSALNNDLAALRNELIASQSVINELSINNSEQNSLRNKSEAELKLVNENLKRLTNENSLIARDLEKATKLLSATKEEGMQLRSTITITNKENEILHSKVAELVSQLEMVTSKLEKLNEQLSLVSQEKSVIQGQFIQLQNSL